MSEVKRCAACGKENPVSEMKVCMHHQMHRYVCDSKCMTDFYNQPKKPTAAELEAKVAALEAELAKLRAGGEPVAWQVSNPAFGFWHSYRDEYAALAVADGQRGAGYGTPVVTPLYTAPQPSAMPERDWCEDGYPSDDWLYVEGWNACLDEFARLNGKEVV